MERVQVRLDDPTIIITGATILDNENIGSGVGVYKQVLGTTAQFRSISGGTGTEVVQSGDTILINNITEHDYVTNETFSGYTGTTELRLEGIEADVSGNTQNIFDNRNLITGNTADISSNYNLITGNTESINDNTTNINSNSAAITGNTADISVLQTKTQHQSADSTETTFGSILKVVEATTSEDSIIDVKAPNFAGNKAILKFTDPLDNNKGEIRWDGQGSNNFIIDKQGSDNLIIEGTIWSTLTNQVSTNTSDISGNTANITANSDSITANTAAINVNSAAININAGNISGNTTAIETKIDKVTGAEPNVPIFKADGNIEDSGYAIADLTGGTGGDFVTTETFTGYTAQTQTDLNAKVDINTYNDDMQIVSDEIDAISGDTAQNTLDIEGKLNRTGDTVTGDLFTFQNQLSTLSTTVDVVGAVDTGTTRNGRFRFYDNLGNRRMQLEGRSDGSRIFSDGRFQVLGGGDLELDGDNVKIGDLYYAKNDAPNGYVLTTDGALNLTLQPTASDSSKLDVDVFTGYTATTEVTLDNLATGITSNATGITANAAAIENKVDINVYNDDLQIISDDIDLLESGKLDITGDTMTGSLSVPNVIFQTGVTVTEHIVGGIHWNETDATTERHLKHGTTLQDGQEILVYGVAYEDLTDGDVVSIYGFTSGGTPILGKADIPTFGTDFYTGNDIAIMTSSAVSGGTCYASIFGKVRSLDTSALSATTTLWLSNTVRGELTNINPVYPQQALPIAFVAKQHATEGEIIVNPAEDLNPKIQNLQYYDEYFTGTFVQKIAITTYETGGTVYITVQAAGTGSTNFDIIWGTDEVINYSAQTIALTSGTDTLPVMNWVSMNKTGIQNNSNYFTGNQLDTDGQFGAIAKVLVQSASGVSASNVYRCHGWIDRCETDGRGDNVKVGERLRASNAEWSNGVDFTFLHTVGTPDRVDITTTAGIIFQKNRNSYDIKTSIGNVDPIWWANNETTPYLEVEHLGLINTLADGTAVGNSDWVSIVVWGCSSQNENQNKLYANASTGDYNTEEAARSDALNYAVYTIPEDFKGSGFLIARILVRVIGEELVELGEQIDLRGLSPDSTGGGVIGGGGTILTKQSLEADIDLIYHLVGDVDTPNNGEYYGYSGGTRGWFTPDVDISNLVTNDTFNTYTGDTETRLSGIEDDVTYLSGETASNTTGITANTLSITENANDITYLSGVTDTKSDKVSTIVSLSGNTTIDSTYSNKIIECDGIFAVTLPNGLDAGFKVDIVNVGTGSITIGASTTLQSEGNLLETQYTGAACYHRGSDVWIALGRLTS